MDSGYWKVVAEEDTQEILALFTPDGKRRLKLIPMRELNEAPKLVATTMKLKMEWDIPDKEHGLKNVASKITVDDVLLYGITD